MPSMFIGGAERSLLGLLDAFDYEQFDVSLFLYRHEGEFLSMIPEKVKVLSPIDEYATFDVPIKHLLKSRLWRFGIARIVSKIAKKAHCILSGEKAGIWMSMQFTSRFLQPLLPKIPGDYDVGIMFLGVADTLVHKVSAKKKITWNHTDYTDLAPDRRLDLSTYKNVKYIISVSPYCTKQFLSCYPELSGKALTIGNILSEKLILEQSTKEEIPIEKNEKCFNLLSVGRFSNAKNFDNIPEICRLILAMGLSVMWYLIGYGGDEALIRKRIAENGMENRVIILGKKENPYPYIKACDLYVQPSRYEGKCVSVLEAQILNKPVVISNYATSESQLKNGYDGVIVPLDNEECAKGIVAVLKDRELQKQLIENTKKEDYTNAEELQKLYRLIEA